jgi:hypothetical protein
MRYSMKGLTIWPAGLQELVIDERTSCLGGMTDDLARALAARCPQLKRLEVCSGPQCVVVRV